MFSTMETHFCLRNDQIRAVPSFDPETNLRSAELHHWMESTLSSCASSSRIRTGPSSEAFIW